MTSIAPIRAPLNPSNSDAPDIDGTVSGTRPDTVLGAAQRTLNPIR
jgi:hypothetical protein